MGAGGGFAPYYPVFKFNPLEENEEDDEEEEHGAFADGILFMADRKVKPSSRAQVEGSENLNIEKTGKKTIDIKEKNNQIIQKLPAVKSRKYRLGRNIYPKLRKYASTTRQKEKIPDNIINISDLAKSREKRQKISTTPNFLAPTVLVSREVLSRAA
jgi:hypothetical protein